MTTNASSYDTAMMSLHLRRKKAAVLKITSEQNRRRRSTSMRQSSLHAVYSSPSSGNVFLWCRNMDPLGRRHEDTGSFPHEASATDVYLIYAAAHVSNAELLRRSGLSTIGDILRHRRLSLFSHVARSGAGVYQHMMLCV